MKSAYYSRNCSYSRSANAEAAEEEGRLPKTRAAKEIGVSLKLFNAAIAAGIIETNEWHHVGKYANEVDYWDTVEIGLNYRFWRFIINNSRGKIKEMAELKRKEAINYHAAINYKEKSEKWFKTPENPKFAAELKKRCEKFPGMLEVIVRALDNRGWHNAPYISYGSHWESGRRCEMTRAWIEGGQCSDGGYVMPFDLSRENLKKVIREISLKKFKQWQKNRNFVPNRRREWITKGIFNLNNGKNFLDHNSGMGCPPAWHDLKNRIILNFNARKAAGGK